MDKKILRTLAVLTVGFGLNALTTNNAAAQMTGTHVPVETCDGWKHPPRYIAKNLRIDKPMNVMVGGLAPGANLWPRRPAGGNVYIDDYSYNNARYRINDRLIDDGRQW